MAAREVVILTTSRAVSDESFIKMTTFTFQCLYQIRVQMPCVMYKIIAIIAISCLTSPYLKHLGWWPWPKQCITLQWRHNGRGSVSNHQPHQSLLNRLFRRRWKKTSKLRVTGLCVGNSPGTGEFPAQMASKAENLSIWWRHHEQYACMLQHTEQSLRKPQNSLAELDVCKIIPGKSCWCVFICRCNNRCLGFVDAVLRCYLISTKHLFSIFDKCEISVASFAWCPGKLLRRSNICRKCVLAVGIFVKSKLCQLIIPGFGARGLL